MTRDQRLDQPLVADGKAHAPARHGIGLGERGELDRDIHGARNLQDRRRRLALEIDLGISEIGEHDQIVLLGEADDLPIEIEIDDDCAVGLAG